MIVESRLYVHKKTYYDYLVRLFSVLRCTSRPIKH